jgi:ribose transport system substrate-binding protein
LYTSFIASDHEQGGELMGKALADAIGGSGDIAAIGSLPENKITQARIAGLKAALKSYPNIHLVTTLYPEITQVANQTAAASLLIAHPNLKAIYTTNFIVAGGVAAALRNANKVGKIVVTSWDAGASNVKLLQEKVLTATVAQQPYTMGRLAIQQIAKKLQGQPTDKTVHAPLSILTSTDVDTSAGKKLWYSANCSGG